HVRLYERSTPEQLNGMLAGEFDVGFVTTNIARPDECEALLVERAPIIAAVPAGSRLAKGQSVTLQQLAGKTFIIPPPRYAAPPAEPFATFKAAGVTPPQRIQEVTQTNTTLGLVGAGFGCSFVMATAALARSHNVRYLPIKDDVRFPPWEMMMAWMPD